jgi:predicted dehydrogenase
MAFAGTGSISRVHAERARLLPALELAAVINHAPESRRWFAQHFAIPHEYTTVEEALEAGGFDALVVSTPNYLHAPQTLAALEAGVHVLVEKPMAMNASEAARMVAASQKSGALLMVAHCFRYEPEVEWLRSQVSLVGAVIRTKAWGVHVQWGPSGWFTQKEFAGGGALADVGIHAIDTSRCLLGDPIPLSVYAKVGSHYTGSDVDDTVAAFINWDNGVVSYIEAGWWQPLADHAFSAVQVFGSRGVAALFPTRIDLTSSPLSPLSADEVRLIPYPLSETASPGNGYAQSDRYALQMAHFVDCIRQSKPPLTGGEAGLINMQITDAAYESSRTGKVVEIPPTQELPL